MVKPPMQVMMRFFLPKRAASQQLQALSDKVVAELREDPSHPEKTAEATGTTLIHADNLQAGDPIPGIGPSKEFTDATAALRKGEVMAGPVVLQDGKALIGTVTDVQPAHPANLDEARAEAKTRPKDFNPSPRKSGEDPVC